MAADQQVKGVREELSFHSVEQRGDVFVLTRAVLPKAVTLARVAVWEGAKHTHIYLHCFAFQKDPAKETVPQS